MMLPLTHLEVCNRVFFYSVELSVQNLLDFQWELVDGRNCRLIATFLCSKYVQCYMIPHPFVTSGNWWRGGIAV